MIFENKKAQFLQVTVAVVFIILISIVSVFVFRVSDEINDDLQADLSMTNDSKQLNDELNTSYPGIFDGLVVLIFVGVWFAALIAAFNSSGNPFWTMLAIIIIASLAFVGMALSNVWEDIDTDPEMSGFTDSFPMTDFILTNYLIFVLLMGFTTLIVLVTRGGGGV